MKFQKIVKTIEALLHTVRWRVRMTKTDEFRDWGDF